MSEKLTAALLATVVAAIAGWLLWLRGLDADGVVPVAAMIWVVASIAFDSGERNKLAGVKDAYQANVPPMPRPSFLLLSSVAVMVGAHVFGLGVGMEYLGYFLVVTFIIHALLMYEG